MTSNYDTTRFMLPARLAVRVVRRADRVARLAPLVVAPFAQVVEAAGRDEMLRAVDRDGLAVEPFAAGHKQERREILQFRHLSDPAHGIDRYGACAGLLAGAQTLRRAFGRKYAGRDRVETDAVAAPLDRERARHRGDRGLAHRGWHHIGPG